MKNKKTLHIIPHSHWDREWYQPFEGHRVKLVELVDAIIEEMEKDPDYTYYHMDGQFIPVEDYLEIRPQMKDRLTKLIQEGRIRVGPWYVLQDEYLTSGEANVRNMLYGMKLCRQMGASPVMTGYFPDSFGNVSQAPQICAGFGIDNAVFGRGLNPMRSQDPVILEKGINHTETIWRSPDGSEVIGVLLADWYSNANELPSEPEKLKNRILSIADSLSEMTLTDDLLGMNGCDHQPLQKNLSQIIKTANAVQDKYEVKQSNLEDYLAKIRPFKDQMSVYEGEIAGQYFNGYGLLINTASTHIDIKQKNHLGQHKLERLAEPLNALASLFGKEYPADFFLYAWRKLMQNHPHDSICTCSCDEVYKEMLTRFEKSGVVADRMLSEAEEFFANAVSTSGGETGKAILVFSLEPQPQTTVVTFHVDFDRDDSLTDLTVCDEQGHVLPISYQVIRNQFTYTLPKDRFRQPKYVDRFEITMPVTTNGVGYRVYSVKRGKTELPSAIQVGERSMESSTLLVSFEKEGSFTLTDKRTGQVYSHQNLLIDEEDAGESYNFAPGSRPTLTSTKARVFLEKQTPFSATFGCEIFLSPEETILSHVTLTEGIDRVDIATDLDNKGENHRIRATFASDVKTDSVLAEGQFDLVKRPIEPAHTWKNPSNDQKMQAFVTLESEERSLAVASRGLFEYEVKRDPAHTLHLTLLRGVGYMGDWGIFPTPLAQCKGKFTLEYSVIPYVGKEQGEAYQNAYAFSSPAVLAFGCDTGAGKLPAVGNFFSLNNRFIRMSALKKAEESDSLILRLFNVSDQEQTVSIPLSPFTQAWLTGMDEKRREELSVESGVLHLTFGKKKILTIELK